MKLEKKEYKNIRYLVSLPNGYKQSDKYFPLIFFLHGAGERGNDLELLLQYGPIKIVKKGQDLPFIIVAPQCPRGQYWSIPLLKELLENVSKFYKVEQNRIYLTGVSMGGYGTWALAIDSPSKFAAIAPICGGGDPSNVHRIKHVPTWVFHGALDDIVPLEESEIMVNALKEVNGNVKFTIYPGLKHDSWTLTYNNPNLYEWLLEHRLKSK